MAVIWFTTTILKFRDKGEMMTNWTYLLITGDQAARMNHLRKTGFRVTGKLDNLAIEKIALQPTGDGNFYMPLNATIRKKLRKEAGATVNVQIAVDQEPPQINAVLLECLQDEPVARANFDALKRSHQLYFSNWVNSAKTAETKANRIAHCVNALAKNYDYGQMIRSLKKDK